MSSHKFRANAIAQVFSECHRTSLKKIAKQEQFIAMSSVEFAKSSAEFAESNADFAESTAEFAKLNADFANFSFKEFIIFDKNSTKTPIFQQKPTKNVIE